MDNFIDIENQTCIVDSLIENWQLKNHKIDDKVLNDIKSAIHDAYTLGCFHGGIDSNCFNIALRKIQNNP
jgi:RIO-like serine/threonine protein kinase